MRTRLNLFKGISGVTYYRLKTMITIAVVWTIIDAVSVYIFSRAEMEYPQKSMLFRAVFVFCISLFISYFFPATLRRFVQKYPLWLNLLVKFLAVLIAALLMNFLVYLIEHLFIDGLTFKETVDRFFAASRYVDWFLQRTFYWVLLLVLTQLYIEINEKYAPGVFKDILMGKYYIPKEEKRIVMFIDLKDSTPIAERLAHQRYFMFIREFINLVSIALIDNYGRIYQYVGDEVVVSWPATPKNARRAIQSLIDARKMIQKNNNRFRRKFNEVPSFRAGIHVGDVTIGEIGVIKKDLAISGDTMNTTARIRSACTEFNANYIVSEEFRAFAGLEAWQCDNLGRVDLKGKAASISLCALKL